MKGDRAMTRKNYALITGAMLLAILLTNFGLFVAPVISDQTIDQDRTTCVQGCQGKSGFGEYWAGVGNNSLLLQICIDNCEGRFWREWQKEMDNVGKD